MSGNSAVRNRSEPVTVLTPRGPVEIVRQEMRGLKRSLGWQWFWLARRRGQQDWREATTALEAIRKAVLLPPRKPPTWLTRQRRQQSGGCSTLHQHRQTPPLPPSRTSAHAARGVSTMGRLHTRRWRGRFRASWLESSALRATGARTTSLSRTRWTLCCSFSSAIA
jgi:hypothetical protein